MNQVKRPDKKWLAALAVTLATILVNIGIIWGDVKENTRHRLNADKVLQEVKTNQQWIMKSLDAIKKELKIP